MKVLGMITNLDVILNKCLNLSSLSLSCSSMTQLRTCTVHMLPGWEIAANHILMCTGQILNTRLLATLNPTMIDPTTALMWVLRIMQLCCAPPKGATPPATAAEQATPTDTTLLTTPYPHIFAIGNAADAFGAIAMGHNAHYQGKVMARNVLQLINQAAQCNGKQGIEQEQELLEEYTPGPPAIKDTAVFQLQGIVGLRGGGADAHEDLCTAQLLRGTNGCLSRGRRGEVIELELELELEDKITKQSTQGR
ncbi:hypothetical protein C0993_006392, partial [Termitomyces sp. T159_Od127]